MRTSHEQMLSAELRCVDLAARLQYAVDDFLGCEKRVTPSQRMLFCPSHVCMFVLWYSDWYQAKRVPVQFHFTLALS